MWKKSQEKALNDRPSAFESVFLMGDVAILAISIQIIFKSASSNHGTWKTCSMKLLLYSDFIGFQTDAIAFCLQNVMQCSNYPISLLFLKSWKIPQVSSNWKKILVT